MKQVNDIQRPNKTCMDIYRKLIGKNKLKPLKVQFRVKDVPSEFEIPLDAEQAMDDLEDGQLR